MIFCATLLCFIFHTAKAQFPDHVDLEKLGEVEYNNEKYKILRPSVHKIRDQFKDFMTKSDSDLPPGKVLMDHNGFRHYWSTLVESKSRKFEDSETIDVNLIEKKVIDYIAKHEQALKIPTTTIESITSKSRIKKMRKNDVLKAIKQRWMQGQTLNSEILKAGKVYPVETTMYCPYLGVVKTTHYLKDDPASFKD